MKLKEIMKGQIDTNTDRINRLAGKSKLSLQAKTGNDPEFDDTGREKFWGTNDGEYEPERRKETAQLRRQAGQSDTNIFRRTAKTTAAQKAALKDKDNPFMKYVG